MAAGADQPSTRQLIDALAAPNFKLREAATQTLETAGEAVLAELRQAQPHRDAEARKRLAQLIARIERNYLLAPKRVSLHADNLPADQLFADLSRQTGYAIACSQGAAATVSLHADNVAFWEAVDLVCRQSGHGLQGYGESDGLMFTRVGQFSPHVSYAGQFRVAASGFYLSRSLDLAVRQLNPLNPQRNETLTMSIQVCGEPKAALMSLGQPRISLAEDDAGNSLIPPQARVYESAYHDYSHGPRNPLRQTQLQLLGPGSAQAIRRIQGMVPVTYLAEKRPELTIDSILQVKDRRFDSPNLTFEINEVREMPGNQVHIHATVRRNVGENQHDYSWTNSLAQRLELVDAQGRKYTSEGFNWDSGSPTSVTGTFQFNDGGNAKLGKAAKLIYYNWITSQHEVTFEFRDLPLP